MGYNYSILFRLEWTSVFGMILQTTGIFEERNCILVGIHLNLIRDT